MHVTHETRFATIQSQVLVNAREIVSVSPCGLRCTLTDGFDHTSTYEVFKGQLLVTGPDGNTTTWFPEDFERWYAPLPNQRTAWV